MCHFLRYRIIILIINIISLGQISLSYISNTSHTCGGNRYTIQTHGLRNHSKANIFRPCRNCRCQRFDLLLFRRFSSICRHYDRSCRRSGCQRSTGRWRPMEMQLTPLFDGSLANNGRSLVHSNKHSRGRHGFREFLDVFHVYKNC